MTARRTSEGSSPALGRDLAALTRQRPVLLSDDCLELMLLTKLILERSLNLTVVAPTDPYLTIRLVQTQPISLVISDVSKPGMDGLSMLAALREDPIGRAVPFLFVSAYVDGVGRARELGAAGYLLKPVIARELADTVADILQQEAGASPATPGLPARFDTGFLADWHPLPDPSITAHYACYLGPDGQSTFVGPQPYRM